MNVFDPDTQSVSNRFSAAAGGYDASSLIQQKTALLLMCYLPEDIHFKKVLDVGCGTGFFTGLIQNKLPAAFINGIDISPAMVTEAKHRLAGRLNVTFSVADACSYHEETSYDLIVSSSSLQWMQPLEKCFQNLISLITPAGYFVSAIMIKGTFAELHEARLRVVPQKITAMQLSTGKKVLSCLEKAGMTIVRSREVEFQEMYPSCQDFLLSIHRQGVTGGRSSRAQVPLTRGDIQQLSAYYDACYKYPYIRYAKKSFLYYLRWGSYNYCYCCLGWIFSYKKGAKAN